MAQPEFLLMTNQGFCLREAIRLWPSNLEKNRKNKKYVDELRIHLQLHSSKFRLTPFTEFIGVALDLRQLQRELIMVY